MWRADPYDWAMNDNTDPVVGEAMRERERLEPVLEELRHLVTGPDAELAQRFAELLLDRASSRAVHGRTAAELARVVADAFAFLCRSRPDRVDVEVLNPEGDSGSWETAATIIRTGVSERPFIVDTLRALLHSEGLAIERFIYPVLYVARDEAGRPVDVGPVLAGTTRESIIHCEVTRVSDPAELDRLRQEITTHLQAVVAATDDFQKMTDVLDETVEALAGGARDVPFPEAEVREAQAFLRWLRDGAFVFLGYRGYEVVEGEDTRHLAVQAGSGLGILRREADSSMAEPVSVDALPARLRDLLDDPPLLLVSKTNAISPVHRRTRMDYIGVRRVDLEGRLVGERRFLGLFTSKAYAEDAENIPILRQKLSQILEQAGVHPGSHDYKEIRTIVNSLPKEELFLTSVEEIAADVRTILTTLDFQEIRVTLRRDRFGRGVSVMVILAKDRFSGQVRRRIEEAFVEKLGGDVLNYHLVLGEGDLARLHFFLAAAPERVQAISPIELEAIVRRLTRTWEDRVGEGLERVVSLEESRRLARVYAEGFSPEYQAATPPDRAVPDILELEAMAAEDRPIAIAFTNPEVPPAGAGGEPVTEFKLYLRGSRLILSEFLPILEHCGLRILSVTPFEVRSGAVAGAVLHSFLIQGADHRPLDIEEVGPRLAETILAVRGGIATDDTMNGLVVSAGLAWREVEVLRAYASYAFQLGIVPSRLSLPTALRAHPGIASLLFRTFRVRFDPEWEGSDEERSERESKLREAFFDALSWVDLLSDDRALRRLSELIAATLRTNYFRNGGRELRRLSDGAPYLALKFDCAAFEGSVRTRLRTEVWVRSARMEGVHMRGALVARGGIRHSDRVDDFRTEVHGLVRTQMVKNAVIVPAGAKGGFVTLRAVPATELGEEVRAQYRTLIRGLLDLTDNLRDGEPEPPEGVVCYDAPDPYLVVAADKGTAGFSDLANELAAEYGFWMGDAFASGGSNGYDHKEVGITARGAWECVKRHFREMGKDIQSEPFSVVGIGDMSGDVFGNGMLLSQQIRLIAAFDHRDIFLDPDPDPESSYEERKRVFSLGRSSWQDYDRALLSEGGMIVPRGAKEVHLSKTMRAALGIAQDEGSALDGEELIRRVLQAPAELLWNGGIGTYVKGSNESHRDVGDTTNDAVRVDANTLRCRVVGEGGNLGFTQQARIEYGLLGGRINTDAIDNSGGVDLSDREVNLKILLDGAVREGTMDLPARNQLLRTLADPVAALVLADNRSQSRAVSLEELRARDSLDDLKDLISALEKGGRLNRIHEVLPSWEVLAERQERDQGFTRPELAVLLGHAKLHLKAHLLESDLPEDPAVTRYLRDYFPTGALEAANEAALFAHRLRREIAASQITNDLVDLMGATFVHAVGRDTGTAPVQVVRAWLVASRLTGERELMTALRGRSPTFPLAAANRWLLGLGSVLDRTTRWFLNNEDMQRSILQIVQENLGGLATLRAAFPDIVTGEDRRVYEELVAEIRSYGVDADFSRGLVTLHFLDQLLEVLRVHLRHGFDPLDAARTYYLVAELFRIPWLRESIHGATGDDRWEQRSSLTLLDDLNGAHQRLVTAVLAFRSAQGLTVPSALDGLVRAHHHPVDRYQDTVEAIAEGASISLAATTVIVRELMHLADRFSATASSG